MSVYAGGRRAEYVARDYLQACGYTVMRSAGSKGAVDLAGWNEHQLVLIQVKRGTAKITKADRERLMAMAWPDGTYVAVWNVIGQFIEVEEVLWGIGISIGDTTAATVDDSDIRSGRIQRSENAQQRGHSGTARKRSKTGAA